MCFPFALDTYVPVLPCVYMYLVVFFSGYDYDVPTDEEEP